jgi:hypothetical protein
VRCTRTFRSPPDTNANPPMLAVTSVERERAVSCEGQAAALYSAFCKSGNAFAYFLSCIFPSLSYTGIVDGHGDLDPSAERLA